MLTLGRWIIRDIEKGIPAGMQLGTARHSEMCIVAAWGRIDGSRGSRKRWLRAAGLLVPLSRLVVQLW